MRLVSFVGDSGSSWGVVKDEGIVDIGARLPRYPTMRSALDGRIIDAVRDLANNVERADHRLDAVVFEPVIPEPRQILCVGLNYEEHRVESRREAAGHPTIFARTASTQIGHRRAILLPPESSTLDYEGELAIVIGRTCRRVAPAEALSAVAGYACYNDASIREYQRHTSQFHPGKNWPATGGFGPWLVTADEIADPTALTVETRLNGVVVQSAGLDQMIFKLPELISYCSVWTELRAGDVIVTGTPGGVGAARKPPLWMKDGDIVEVEISRVGVLTNWVEAECFHEIERRDPSWEQ